MDDENGWNNLSNYSLFWPEESFNLFGDQNFDFDINDFFGPPVDEANNAFDIVGHDEQQLVEPSESDHNYALPSTLIEHESSRNYAQTITLHSEYPDDRCPGLYQCLNNSAQASKTSSAALHNGSNEHEHPPSIPLANRELFQAFSASSGDKVRLRSRKRFSAERKKVVAMNRMIGVCLHCKLRKVACNDGIPCDQCIKRAGSILSGQEICMRRSLVATRFDHIDLVTVSLVESSVKELTIPLDLPPSGWGYIWFPSTNGNLNLAACIKVPVIDFKPAKYKPIRVLISANYYSSELSHVGNAPQAIVPAFTPSIETLIEAYERSRGNFYSVPSPFARLYKAVRDFMRSYCNTAIVLPLKGLLSDILYLQRLFNIHRTMPLIKPEPGSHDEHFVSKVIALQLRLPICRAIKATETCVLADVDKLMQSKTGIGRQNPLATWAALWGLLLTYKEHMVLCKAMRHDSDYSEKIYCLSQHLYNMLTSTYAALYSTTSPLTLDWRGEEVAAMLGNDPDLIGLFCNIKTEMFWIQAYTHEFFPEDTLFKKLVLENENKLLAARIKTAKRRGEI